MPRHNAAVDGSGAPPASSDDERRGRVDVAPLEAVQIQVNEVSTFTPGMSHLSSAHHQRTPVFTRPRNASMPPSTTPPVVSEEKKGEDKKYGKAAQVLFLLVLQNSALTITMRASRLPGRAEVMYLATAAVVLCELIKLIVSLGMLLWESGSVATAAATIHRDILSSWSSNALLLVPATLYTLQNNLQYYAAGHLDPATFQVLYQMKLLTTAALSVVLLKRDLSRTQWFSTVVLAVGIGLVQTDNMVGSERESQIEGFIAVLVACCTSAGAGVFLEKLVKQTAPSVWVRNIQLASFGLMIGGAAAYVRDADVIAEKGFFVGFDAMVWAVVLLQSFGGVLVAVVLKYADNIVKGFATGLSIITSAGASVVLFQLSVSVQYFFGSAAVVVCNPPPQLPRTVQ